MSEKLKLFSSAYLAQRTRLIAYCYALLQNRALAEELFQEIYVKMAEALSRGEEIRDLDRWCRGVARNLALVYWREKRTSKLVLSDSLVSLMDKGFEEQRQNLDVWDDRKLALENCLGNLPAGSRRMIEQKYVEGISIRDLASLLQRTPEATMQALYRVRRALSDCIEQRVQTEGAR